MRALSLLLALPSVAFAADTGTIGHAPLEAGQSLVFSEVSVMTMKMEVDAGPGVKVPMELAFDNSIPHTVRILEVVEGEVKAVELAFGDAFNNAAMMGTETREALPVANQRYKVVRDASAHVVTRVDGTPASEEEVTEARERADSVFVDDAAMDGCLPEGPLTAGLEVDLRTCTSFLPGSDGEFGEAKVVLRRFDLHEGREAAFFELTVVRQGAAPGGGPEVRMDSSGLLVLDALTGRPLVVTMQGPISMSAVEDGVEMSATGTILLRLGTSFQSL